MKKQNLFITILILILLVVLFRMFVLHNVAKINTIAQNEFTLDSNTYSKNIPGEYAKLLKTNGELVINRTDESKRRNPISEYFYRNKFYIQIYKIDTIGDASINKIVKEDFASTKVSFSNNYIQFENSIPFRINYKLEAKPQNISIIYFTLFGTGTKAIKKNEDMVYYYSKFENFSISYNQVGSKDIYGNLNENFQGKRLPSEIMFLKQNKNLYYILLASTGDGSDLDPNMLSNLINQRR